MTCTEYHDFVRVLPSNSHHPSLHCRSLQCDIRNRLVVMSSLLGRDVTIFAILAALSRAWRWSDGPDPLQESPTLSPNLSNNFFQMLQFLLLLNYWRADASFLKPQFYHTTVPRVDDRVMRKVTKKGELGFLITNNNPTTTFSRTNLVEVNLRVCFNFPSRCPG